MTAEWASNRITAFDIKPDGRLEHRRVFATLSGPNQGADGICLDNHGGIWTGVPMDKDVEGLRSPGFLRIGRRWPGYPSHSRMKPGRRAVACAFGGVHEPRPCSIFAAPVTSLASGFKTISRGRPDQAWIKITGFSGAGEYLSRAGFTFASDPSGNCDALCAKVTTPPRRNRRKAQCFCRRLYDLCAADLN